MKKLLPIIAIGVVAFIFRDKIKALLTKKS
jgi:hypothetical protein